MKYEVLKRYFGYDSFREGQEKLVDSILSGRDTLGIMPTGAGKSLCFQVPALCMSGITLVISPLISLMKDQVSSLIQVGVRAAYLNSSLTWGQYLKALYNAGQGMYKIIYVAPERLETKEFLSFAKRADISMVTVDEAHCVSQWGHDFRPGYLKIREFIDELPKRPVISAFTATATGEVRSDIVNILRLKEPTVVITGFDRKNLFFGVEKPKNKNAELVRLIGERREKSGIVYCATRKNVEAVCELLLDKGFSAVKYHAGMADDERSTAQDDFLFDRSRVMVATNAFGMGIDKSNVSYVIHYNMPKNLENYYQEAGRAGRDGSPAECILLYSRADIMLNKFLIDNSGNDDEDIEAQAAARKQDIKRLYKIQDYCETTGCLRRFILGYFGERTAHDCNNCSNCKKTFKEVDITEYVIKILSCIKETGQRFGVSTVCDILKGKSKNRNIEKYDLQGLRTYSALKELSEHNLRDIVTLLENSGYIRRVGDEYPTLSVTKDGERLFYEDKRLKMKVADDAVIGAKKKSHPVSDNDGDAGLFELLKKKRASLATQQGVPAFVIFSDATLRQMASLMPQTKEELLTVSGVGYVKSEKYGRDFLRIINEYKKNK